MVFVPLHLVCVMGVWRVYHGGNRELAMRELCVVALLEGAESHQPCI